VRASAGYKARTDRLAVLTVNSLVIRIESPRFAAFPDEIVIARGELPGTRSEPTASYVDQG